LAMKTVDIVVLLNIAISCTDALSFYVTRDPSVRPRRAVTALFADTSSILPNNPKDDPISFSSFARANTSDDTTETLKQKLLKLAASYDRGFGATPTVRKIVASIVNDMEARNSNNTDVATSILRDDETSLLDGTWRMVWTTAIDVLSLQASPMFATGAIHQVYIGRSVTNVIDFIPRPQILFPPSLLPNSQWRANVQTKACPPSTTTNNNMNNRIGLIFQAVKVQPMEFLGLDCSMFPPLTLDLPKLPGMNMDDTTSPGFFDVTFLDQNLLIIRQNQPGGMFVSIRVESIDAAA
jgi:PAP_fibrillin